MSADLRIGSLCTGYGGLDMAVQEVLGGTLTWVADPDPGAAAILAHHWPAVRNLGDITAVDWDQVPPVDVLCAGFPCQDISYAGLGAGIQEGSRSGLWHTIADAIGVLRPPLVYLENVAAIVGRRPGLDVVLADLARLGLDAEWCCVRASDVGGAHQRKRWFCLARSAADPGRHPWPQDLSYRTAVARRGGAASDAASDGRHEGRTEPARLVGGPDAAFRGGAPAADPDRRGLQRHPERHCEPQGGQADDEHLLDADGRVLDWGQYGPAIERWGTVLGQPAPAPRLPTGRDGSDQLSPAFVEWLMGLPLGHVTAVPGLTRNQRLKALGNGVVPLQAAHALRQLSGRIGAAA